jgi:hypothetical protein
VWSIKTSFRARGDVKISTRNTRQQTTAAVSAGRKISQRAVAPFDCPNTVAARELEPGLRDNSQRRYIFPYFLRRRHARCFSQNARRRVIYARLLIACTARFLCKSTHLSKENAAIGQRACETGCDKTGAWRSRPECITARRKRLANFWLVPHAVLPSLSGVADGVALAFDDRSRAGV